MKMRMIGPQIDEEYIIVRPYTLTRSTLWNGGLQKKPVFFNTVTEVSAPFYFDIVKIKITLKHCNYHGEMRLCAESLSDDATFVAQAPRFSYFEPTLYEWKQFTGVDQQRRLESVAFYFPSDFSRVNEKFNHVLTEYQLKQLIDDIKILTVGM